MTTTAPKQRSRTAEQILDLAEILIQTRGYITGEQGGPPRFRSPAGRTAGEAHHWRHIPIAGCCSGHEIAARGPVMKSVDDSADDRAIASEALPILPNPLPKTLPQRIFLRCGRRSRFGLLPTETH